ncbi:MAG: PilW family protein [Polaromonas sp.]|nr:PilW family protein [Polaromonas sp.]
MIPTTDFLPLRARTRRRQSAGITLIELMISMVIGLVLIGVLISLYSGTVGTNTVANAQAEMNEDAQFALKVISGQLRQAGYNPVHPGRTTLNPLPGGFPVFGCDNGFSNPVAAASADLLTCNAAASAGGHAIVATYEADIYNTIPSGGIPTNCLGEALPVRSFVESGVTHNYYVAENRLYVKNNTLYCAGVSAATQEQPLVDNVERIEFSYGASSPTTTSRAVVGYLTATELGAATGTSAGVHAQLTALTAADRWAEALTVRVCVLMRSAKPVFEEDASYYGCDTSALGPADKYLRRAYVTTVALRNRIGTP